MTAETAGKTTKAGHPKLVAVLIGFATLFAVLAIFSIWANRQALNTDNWVSTSDRILQNKEVDALVLWDPVISGAEYLDDIFRTAAARTCSTNGALPRSAAIGGHEILGFPLTDALAAEIRTIDLCTLAASFPARTHVIASQPLASQEALRAELERHARSGLSIEPIESLFAWLQYRDLGAGAVPVKVLEHIVQCLR